MQESTDTVDLQLDDGAEHVHRLSTRTKIGVVLMVIGLLGVLGTTWTAVTDAVLPTDGIRVSGHITGNDSSSGEYFLAFSYQVQGKSYDGRWKAPDQSWLVRMPVGTSIAVSYPPGEPNMGQPIGNPFDSVAVYPLSIILDVLIQGSLPFLIMLAGIALLRGVWRGRTFFYWRRRG